jgi:polysaccharide pyruvyl transferase WcaK-like protein
MKNILLVANGSYQNKGCEAIVRGTVTSVRKSVGPTKFVSVDFGGDYIPDESDPDIKHEPISVSRYSKTWFGQNILRFLGISRTWFPVMGKYIPQVDAVLALGGDNFTMDYGSIRTHLAVIDYVNQFRRPLIIWGASMGPFNQKGPQYEQYVADKLKKCAAILVRETLTKEYLSSIGVKENVRLVADPAFIMQPVEPPDLTIPLKTLNRAIGLNFSPLMARFLDTKTVEEAVRFVTAVIDDLMRVYQRPIVLIPHVIRPGNNDHDFLSNVINALPSLQKHLYLLPDYFSAQETKWIIGQLHCFIGARTHSTIAAISSGIPTISLAYSVKARGINRDIFGHEDHVINAQELTSTNIVTKKVAQLMDNNSQIRTDLQNRLPAIKDRAFSAGNYLKDVVNRQNLRR